VKNYFFGKCSTELKLTANIKIKYLGLILFARFSLRPSRSAASCVLARTVRLNRRTTEVGRTSSARSGYRRWDSGASSHWNRSQRSTKCLPRDADSRAACASSAMQAQASSAWRSTATLPFMFLAHSRWGRMCKLLVLIYCFDYNRMGLMLF